MRFKLKSLHWPASAAVAAGLIGSLEGCPGTLDDPAAFHFGSDAGDSSTDIADTSAPVVDTGASVVDTGTRPLACAAAVPTAILQPSCGVIGCHSATAPASGLDLASPGLAARLINAPGTEMPSSGLLLIDSKKPSQSVLLTKLQAGTVPYGSQMPLGGSALSAQDIACVAAWVDLVIAVPDAGSSD